MKAVELLKIFSEPLNLMSKNGILLEDYKYVEAYEHFLQMLFIRDIPISVE